MEHRIVSLLPLSHALEQAVALYYALDVGRRHPLRPQPQPAGDLRRLREHRVTSDGPRARRCSTCSGARSSARSRSRAGRRRSIGCAASRGICRTPARRLLFRQRPHPARRRPAAVRDRRRVPAARAPAGVGGHGRHRHPGLRRDRDAFAGAATTMTDHPLGCVGWPPKPVEMRIVEDGEIQFRGPTLSRATGTTPRRRPRAIDRGRLVQDGRHRRSRRQGPAPPARAEEGHHRAAQRVQRVSRRTSRTPCAVAGIRDSVALETKPGRIEAVVLRAGRRAVRATPGRRRRSRARSPRTFGAQIDAAVQGRQRASSARNQRIAGWRLWPEADFPRTHTFKVKRDPCVTGVGQRRRAAAGGRRGLRPGVAPPAARAAVRMAVPRLSDRRQRRRGAGHRPGPAETGGEYEKNTSVVAHAADDELLVARVLDRGPVPEARYSAKSLPTCGRPRRSAAARR